MTFKRPDFTTFAGLAVAVFGITGGLLLEGGKLSDVAQLTAALIVLGGTAGAVMITTPMHLLTSAVKKMPTIFFDPAHSADSVIQQIQKFAVKARKSGFVSLDAEITGIEDDFFRKALTLLIDGAGPQEIRRIMEVEIIWAERHGEAEAKVFDCAGGYAPTIGIIGAVLGLIQVMKHLEDLQAVGHGIAIAFVATVYGVSLANLFFLPAANKLRARLQLAVQMKELVLEGVMAMAEGVNPRLIESRLEPFKQTFGKPAGRGRERRVAARTAAAQGSMS